MPLVLRAERDCAYDSPDHLVPWGTRWDRSTNRGRFNEKLWLLYPKTHVVKVLDLGCSGGDFVKSCIDDGHFAVGIEGSTFSRRSIRGLLGRSFRTIFLRVTLLDPSNWFSNRVPRNRNSILMSSRRGK